MASLDKVKTPESVKMMLILAAPTISSRHDLEIQRPKCNRIKSAFMRQVS
jgi:hypothetical protein